MNAQTYLFFDGRCEEALEFYREALGTETTCFLRYKDGPPELTPIGAEEKVFHSTMQMGDTLFNLADDMKRERGIFGGFAILLHADDDDQAKRFFARLSVDGTVQLPIAKTFWASMYGIVEDQFGIVWKVQAS